MLDHMTIEIEMDVFEQFPLISSRWKLCKYVIYLENT